MSWSASSNRTVIYRFVAAAAASGISLDAVCLALPDLTRKSVDTVLSNLAVEGYVIKRKTADGKRYAVDATCIKPVVRGQELQTLMELLRDCEQGVCLSLLASEACLSAVAVKKLLREEINTGRVRRISLPPEHGLVGYQLVMPESAPGPNSVPPDNEPRNVLGDLVHLVPGEYEFRLKAEGELAITLANGLGVCLGQKVTRALFAYLDELGGLNNASRLAA
jgi:hypothetical protein